MGISYFTAQQIADRIRNPKDNSEMCRLKAIDSRNSAAFHKEYAYSEELSATGYSALGNVVESEKLRLSASRHGRLATKFEKKAEVYTILAVKTRQPSFQETFNVADTAINESDKFIKRALELEERADIELDLFVQQERVLARVLDD